MRLGYSRDLHPDRPQVVVGLSADRVTGMPIGLTVNPGNTMVLTHFHDMFRHVLPFLSEHATIVFDNGAYTKDNATHRCAQLGFRHTSTSEQSSASANGSGRRLNAYRHRAEKDWNQKVNNSGMAWRQLS